MKCSLIVLTMMISMTSFAQVKIAQSKEEFCQNRSQPDYFQQILLDEGSKLGFTNLPGKFGTGLCWWHSMFQRNAAYLTIYQPQMPKPTTAEATELIQDIIHNNGIVVIPGFNNLSDFSAYYRNDIIAALENWSVAHTVGLGWLKGAMGTSEVSANELKSKMDDLYKDVVNDKKVVFQVLQLEGIAAHAWLVVGMTKTNGGYKLFVQDSNFMRTQVYEYTEGMTFFRYPSWGKFVPYTYYNSELKSMTRSQKKFCQDGTTSLEGRPVTNNFTNQNTGG